MAAKNPARRAATRKKITDAYEALLREFPNSVITASSVIEKANVNRSTFYDYFDSVIDLHRFIENNLLNDVQKTAREAVYSTGDPDIVRIANRIYSEHGDTMGLLLGSAGSMSFASRIKERLKPLVANALPLSVPPESAPYITEFVTSGMLSAYSSWFESDRDMPLDELAPLIRSMVFACLETVGDTLDRPSCHR